MKFRTRATVAAIAVALAATVLTSQAAAQADIPRDTSSAQTESATPLALRPAKPLELAQDPSHTGLGWKIAAVLAVIGGAAFYLRKRVGPRRTEDGQLTIVRRAAIGIRSELLIVNVEGQRLLLGVTPHSVQSLAVLDGDVAIASQREEAPLQEQALGEQFAAMLRAADSSSGASRADSAVRVDHSAARGDHPGIRLDRTPPRADHEVAGQARGLLALRRQG